MATKTNIGLKNALQSWEEVWTLLQQSLDASLSPQQQQQQLQQDKLLLLYHWNVLNHSSGVEVHQFEPTSSSSGVINVSLLLLKRHKGQNSCFQESIRATGRTHDLAASQMPVRWAKIAQYTTSVTKRALHTHAHTMDFTSLSPLWTLCSLWVLCACVCEPKCIIDVSPPGTDDADQSLWCGNTVAALTLTRQWGGDKKKTREEGRDVT